MLGGGEEDPGPMLKPFSSACWNARLTQQLAVRSPTLGRRLALLFRVILASALVR